jgi:DNA helicase HerA-like ATPase
LVDSESLDARNEADFVTGIAVQLGKWKSETGIFERHGWVPPARTPVTRVQQMIPPPMEPDEIELGLIPGTSIPVVLNRRAAVSHHTAILGVTGVGKSMFARNIVRQLAADDLRVIVVDFTREWKNKLTGTLTPVMIDEATADGLRKAIRDLEQEQAKFKNQQNPVVIDAQKRMLFEGFKHSLDEFLIGDDRVRVFELPDVSNTEGVLEYTQWFFKTLFHVARESNLHGRRVCVVLEEAHTVVPEWNFVGISDQSSRSLVNNISQIALQGRKYEIGFIVIAQRTASVSKTILTQCNTIIAFQCFDGTSLEFLSHYLPEPVVRALPNLGPRRAVAVGKAIRGSVPLIFDVPELVDGTI